MNRRYIKDFVRKTVGQKDFDLLKDALINQMINYGQSQVQMDLINVAGVKSFIKQIYLSGQTVNCPSDMLAIPNAIVDVKASTGTRISGNVNTSASGSMHFEVIEPSSTTWAISWVPGSAISVAVNPSTRIVTMTYNNTVSTNQNVLDALNDSSAFLNYFIPAYMTTAGVGSQIVIVGTTTSTLTAGTTSGWQPTQEISIERFNKIQRDSFQQATINSISYRRTGSSGGDAVLEFLPLSVTQCQLYYNYKLSDLTADTDTSGIPTEYEPLLITNVQAQCYSALQMLNESQLKTAEYIKKESDAQDKYLMMLTNREGDKKNLQTQTPNN